MPPTLAAAITIASILASLIQVSTSACLVKSTSDRSTVTISQFSLASRLTTAEPTMPLCPATQTLLPSSEYENSGIKPAHFSAPILRACAYNSDVFADHLRDEIIEIHLVPPTKLFLCFGRVPNQKLDFGWSKVTRIDLHKGSSIGGIDSLLLYPLALPFNVDAYFPKGALNECADAVGLSGRYHIVIGFRLLQH